MKRRPQPEPVAPTPDVIRDRIRNMEMACRRRSIMVKDPKVREAERQLKALVDSGSDDIDEALRWWYSLEWLREAP